MTKKGGSKHLKRLAAPAFWPILKKEYRWVTKPSPGPHPLGRCIPLLILVRDMLKLAENAREAKRIIFDGEVLVDSKVRRNFKLPVGLMDVVSIPRIDVHVRIIPHTIKYLWYVGVPKEEVNLKLVRIENKSLIKGNRLQLNLHDGRNILISREESQKYKTLDGLLIEIPSQKIVQHIPLEVNKLAIVMDGRNAGRIGRIIEIQEKPGMSRRKFLVTLEEASGHRFQTILEYVMVIGDDKPIIKVSEGT
ncbi:MAG: 30S ribosomal protein S4e [Ignisphaera sp.]|uniref:Small ribosomal subunit protein eS4 n=1 Tax=Ignisphaera aggregans TaxID=334771 RepID=A0A7C4NM31_9CREN